MLSKRLRSRKVLNNQITILSCFFCRRKGASTPATAHRNKKTLFSLSKISLSFLFFFFSLLPIVAVELFLACAGVGACGRCRSLITGVRVWCPLSEPGAGVRAWCADSGVFWGGVVGSGCEAACGVDQAVRLDYTGGTRNDRKKTSRRCSSNWLCRLQVLTQKKPLQKNRPANKKQLKLFA